MEDYVNPYRIREGDLFLIYAAFQRSLHHYNVLQDCPERQKRKFYSGYKDIFEYVKPFFQEKQGSANTQDYQNINPYLIFEYLSFYMKNLFLNKQDFKDLKYSEESDEWKQKFDSHVEKFPTLCNVSNAHFHALDAHYVTDLHSNFIKEGGRLQFSEDRIIDSFDEYRGWTSSPLKEVLMKIPATKRLRWCARLLVGYHYENECSMFMTSAFKLCKNAIKLSPIAESKYAEDVCRTVTCYFDFLRNILSEQFPYRSKFLDLCTSHLFYRLSSSKNFRILLEYGATYGYSHERYLDLIFWIPTEMRGMGGIIANESTTEKCQYYCLQVFYINRMYWKFGDDLLRCTWASISEPFLTEEDIHTCFCHMANNGGYEWWGSATRSVSIYEWAKRVHQWYSQIVVMEEKDVKSPRRLQHLSRCTIRANLRFPINVDSLNLPQKLKDYLMLKE